MMLTSVFKIFFLEGPVLFDSPCIFGPDLIFNYFSSRTFLLLLLLRRVFCLFVSLFCFVFVLLFVLFHFVCLFGCLFVCLFFCRRSCLFCFCFIFFLFVLFFFWCFCFFFFSNGNWFAKSLFRQVFSFYRSFLWKKKYMIKMRRWFQKIISSKNFFFLFYFVFFVLFSLFFFIYFPLYMFFFLFVFVCLNPKGSLFDKIEICRLQSEDLSNYLLEFTKKYIFFFIYLNCCQRLTKALQNNVHHFHRFYYHLSFIFQMTNFKTNFVFGFQVCISFPLLSSVVYQSLAPSVSFTSGTKKQTTISRQFYVVCYVHHLQNTG